MRLHHRRAYNEVVRLLVDIDLDDDTLAPGERKLVESLSRVVEARREDAFIASYQLSRLRAVARRQELAGCDA